MDGVTKYPWGEPDFDELDRELGGLPHPLIALAQRFREMREEISFLKGTARVILEAGGNSQLVVAWEKALGGYYAESAEELLRGRSTRGEAGAPEPEDQDVESRTSKRSSR